jgi:hypothetical protein
VSSSVVWVGWRALRVRRPRFSASWKWRPMFSVQVPSMYSWRVGATGVPRTVSGAMFA